MRDELWLLILGSAFLLANTYLMVWKPTLLVRWFSRWLGALGVDPSGHEGHVAWLLRISGIFLAVYFIGGLAYLLLRRV